VIELKVLRRRAMPGPDGRRLESCRRQAVRGAGVAERAVRSPRHPLSPCRPARFFCAGAPPAGTTSTPVRPAVCLLDPALRRGSRQGRYPSRPTVNGPRTLVPEGARIQHPFHDAIALDEEMPTSGESMQHDEPQQYLGQYPVDHADWPEEVTCDRACRGLGEQDEVTS
jgi:hypothetical protein